MGATKDKGEYKNEEKFVIIIEEQTKQVVNQTVEEVKTINDVLDTLLLYTDYFTPFEDSISFELIERREQSQLVETVILQL